MIWLYLWPLVLISILPLYSPPYVLSLFIFIYFYGHYLILNESELPPDSLLCSSFGLTPTWRGRGEPPEELDFWCKAKCTLLARQYIYTPLWKTGRAWILLELSPPYPCVISQTLSVPVPVFWVTIDMLVQITVKSLRMDGSPVWDDNGCNTCFLTLT